MASIKELGELSKSQALVLNPVGSALPKDPKIVGAYRKQHVDVEGVIDTLSYTSGDTPMLGLGIRIGDSLINVRIYDPKLPKDRELESFLGSTVLAIGGIALMRAKLNDYVTVASWVRTRRAGDPRNASILMDHAAAHPTKATRSGKRSTESKGALVQGVQFPRDIELDTETQGV